MSFTYSCFISYRHNELKEKYITNLKKILSEEAALATNKKEVFFDQDSLRYGEEFDQSIYSRIESSLFFIPIWYIHYLHEDNLFCARELMHALSIEKIIKDSLPVLDRDNFYFIVPIIFRGELSDLPRSLSAKIAIDLKNLEHVIVKGGDNQQLTKIKQKFCKNLTSYYLSIDPHLKKIDFAKLFASIKRPSDDEVKEWISEQKKIQQNLDAEKKPILKKTHG